MIGKLHIEIGKEDFVKGISNSDDINDGGFSPSTDAVNLTKNPGVLYQPAAIVDKSTNLTGSAIAYTSGSASTSVNGFILAGDGKIMSIDSSQVLTASSALSGTFTTGKSDIINFNGKIFATSSTDVARMNTDLSSGDSTWWSSTLSKGVLTSGVPHPLLEFIGYVWVGDLNALHRIESSVAGTKNAFLLDSSWTIVALGVDVTNGTMLISATRDSNSGNASNTLATDSCIFVFDGVSSTPARQIHVDAMITGFRSVGGTTFVSYGQKLGYWNGSGISFLQQLRNVTLSFSELAYKNHMTNIENTLYVIDGKQILAYGEVMPGRKVFYYAQSNNNTTDKYTLICPIGNNKLGLAYTATGPAYKFYSFDTTDVTTPGAMGFISNKYHFPRPVYIRGAYLEYADAVVDQDNNRSLYIKSEDQNQGFQGMYIQGKVNLANTSGAAVYFTNNIISNHPNNKMYCVQLRYISSGITGLKRIVLYYDIAE